MLADGLLGTAKAPLFVASTGTLITRLEVVHSDTGTGTESINLFVRRSNGNSTPITPKDLEMMAGDKFEDCSERHFKAGDAIEGYGSVADLFYFVVDGAEVGS